MADSHHRPPTPAFRAVNTMEVASVPQPPQAASAATAQRSPPVTLKHDMAMAQFTFPRIPENASSNSMQSNVVVSQASDGSGNTVDGEADKALSNADSSEGGKDKSSRGTKSASSGKVKKKKGTKFHCKGFGNCNLSFTRSEHLARHIRKHTGERPFMCHCGRWFSRLDNLRQHSSTVHADEEIPDTSLAASGTRYQRHVRTESVREPSRSRTHSLSEVIAPEPAGQKIQPVPIIPALGSPASDRPGSRRRPDPLVLPQHVVPGAPNFSQYRHHTPPDSPSSIVSSSSYLRSGGAYRHRPAPYPQIHQTASPIATPTPTRPGSQLESPFGTPNSSARNSLHLSTYPPPGTAMHARRLSMPVPPSPSLLNPLENRTLPIPMAPAPTHEQMGGARRDSIGPLDDRRKTWHIGSPPAYQTPLAPENITPATNSLARTCLSNNEASYPPAMPRHPTQDRLPSITHILQETALHPPGTPRLHRGSWVGGPVEPAVQPSSFGHERRPSFDFGRAHMDGRPGPTRRIAPGQVRSSHGRSISNIETKRWGNIPHQPMNPFPTWAERERERIDTTPPRYIANPREQRERREHRQSFGSSGESCNSEGVATPVVGPVDSTKPFIFGEPGEAVFHSDVSILHLHKIETLADP
ncbi:hypothetical protein EX30DRAFT_267950 [Ascodesmis nigricans]|uniref:C2H2-type domain-containing protein n=1 Tax=Ascodesmis nigricans TaxID=341454 RepID=A0A4S2MX14_9PEZI|nr:hypothetical protein EX30DRAFT_267950 [Ascodesmis nigricans]